MADALARDVNGEPVHTCHFIRCPRPVPQVHFMCPFHWRLVPVTLRQAVWRFYRKGQEADKQPSPEYCEAAKAAIRAVAERVRVRITGDEPEMRLYDMFKSAANG